jgi:predicted MFS family arabinose efflux permease
MVLFGIGEIFGCFFIGFIVDRLGSKVAALFNVLIIIIMVVVTVVYISLGEYFWLVYFMTFLWGFQDSAVNTHSQEMLGFEFDNNSEPFTVYNIIQSVGCFIFQIIESYVDGKRN